MIGPHLVRVLRGRKYTAIYVSGDYGPLLRAYFDPAHGFFVTEFSCGIWVEALIRLIERDEDFLTMSDTIGALCRA